jgi:hypothetical protein
LKKAHLRRCASSFGIAAYEKIRLTSQDSRALHLSIFEQPRKKSCRFSFGTEKAGCEEGESGTDK